MKPKSFTGLRHLTIFVLTILFAASPSAWAQTVQFRASRLRVTVPLNSTGSFVITNAVNVSGLGSVVNFDVSGLPAGAGAVLTDSLGNPLTSTLISTGLWLTLNTTNITEGVHTFSLNGTGGASNSILFILQAGHIWNGSTNVAVDGPGNWSDLTKWLGGGVPGASDDVIFTDSGGQTTNLLISGAATNLIVNSIVDNDTTIGSLRFSQTNSATAFHTIQINPGRKLTITGTSGFTMLRDYVDEYAGIGGGMTVTFSGTNGAAMVVSNKNANFSMLIDGIVTHTLDMSRLDNFAATVNVMGLGDQYVYPNFWNLQANGYNGIPRRMVPFINLARTNVITAFFADSNNYTNATDREYGISFVGTLYGNGSVGGSPIPVWNLGISNAFFADSVLIGGPNQRATLQFNPIFSNDFPVAVFRGTNGGRMSTFATADAAGTNGAQGNIKTIVDFGSYGGSVDMLVDRFYAGRDRPVINGGQTPNYQGLFSMGKGIVDANAAILGFREFPGDTTNANYAYNGYCEGRVTVSNTAVFKVNDTLTLGYSTETNVNGKGVGGNTDWGQLVLANGGTVMANTIAVGGPAHSSRNNNITMTGGARLIISNTLAGPEQRLDILGMTDSSLTLHINATNTNPYIYVTSLTTGGGGNSINIGSLPAFTSYPTQITLISFVSGAGNFTIGTLPSGSVVGSIQNNANTIDLIINTNTPQSLIWKGNINGDWDLTTKNWVTTTGVSTNFHDGDFIRFDDTASGVTTVTVTTDVFPGQSVDTAGMTVSNSVLSYNFTNTAGIVQGSRLLKQGGGTLRLDATMTSSVEVSAGVVSGVGGIGSTTVDAGGTLNYSGSISGSLTSSGNAVNAGSVIGPVVVQPGGTVTNTGTTSGSVSLQSGAKLVNLSSGTMNVSGAWSVSATASLVNLGDIIQTGSLTVNGTLASTATIERHGSTTDGGAARVAVNGTFAPSGSSAIGTNLIATRLDLNSGSTTVFEVDIGAGTNDLVFADSVNFGNPGSPAFIVITNIGSGSFSAGQSFQLLAYSFGGPFNPVGADPNWNTNNIEFSIVPATPGAGLVWDSSDFRTNGFVKIVSSGVNTTPTNITFSLSGNVLTLSWPEDHIGWTLQAQTNTLQTGISTNWVAVSGSSTTNQVFLTNNPADGTVFFRLVY